MLKELWYKLFPTREMKRMKLVFPFFKGNRRATDEQRKQWKINVLRSMQEDMQERARMYDMQVKMKEYNDA